MPYAKPFIAARDVATETACCSCNNDGSRNVLVSPIIGVRQNPDGSYTASYDILFGGDSQAYCNCG